MLVLVGQVSPAAGPAGYLDAYTAGPACPTDLLESRFTAAWQGQISCHRELLVIFWGLHGRPSLPYEKGPRCGPFTIYRENPVRLQ
ncbi:hypothetical protein CWE09_01700 [Aliidiomarina minuta]|uniref:Uncharacterized protein n=1 Tax=Aliidiomarina minuta TaxID=880057 RepID=A0A432W5Z1_9GAMM|nr:hypothetical protein CWE09_01700 [Aliidiomarina minuta]